MVIPLSLVGGAISALSKLFTGGSPGSGSNASGHQSPIDFKNVMHIMQLAKQVEDKISPQDKANFEQALQKGDLNTALQILQGALAQLLNGGGTAVSTASTTAAASTMPPPATAPATTPTPAVVSTPLGMSLLQVPRYGTPGITTNGDRGQLLANGTANPITTDAQAYLNSLVGAGKTKPLISTAGVSTYQNTPAVVPLNAGANTGAATQSPSPSAAVPQTAVQVAMQNSAQNAAAAAAPAAAAAGSAAATPGAVAAAVQNAAVANLQAAAAMNANGLPSTLASALAQATGSASAVPNGSLQVAMANPTTGARNGPDAASGSAAVTGAQALATETGLVASIQVGAQNPAGSGANSQESFFMLNALRHDLKAAGGTDADPSADASFSSHLDPALAYQAPSLSAAQIDHAVAASIDNQKLINQIMDGVFKAPMQLPKTVTLDLNPAHLGPLNVQVTMHDDGVRVQMMTPHAAVKAALENSVGDLKLAMNHAGLNLGSFGVDVGQGQGFARFAQQFGNPSRNAQWRTAWNPNQPDDDNSPVERVAAPTVRSVQNAMARLGAVNAFA